MKKERTGWLIAAICLTVISALLWLAAGNFWSGLTSRMEEGILLCLPGEVPEEMLAYAEEEGWQDLEALPPWSPLRRAFAGPIPLWPGRFR